MKFLTVYAVKSGDGFARISGRVTHAQGAYDNTTLCGKVFQELRAVDEEVMCSRCMERMARKIMLEDMEGASMEAKWADFYKRTGRVLL